MQPHYIIHIKLSQLFNIIIYSNGLIWDDWSIYQLHPRYQKSWAFQPRNPWLGFPTSISKLTFFEENPQDFGVHILLGNLSLKHKLCHVSLHARPPINSFQISIHLDLDHTRINNISRTTRLRLRFLSQFIHSRNTYSPVKIKHTIHIKSVLFFLTKHSLFSKFF